MVGDGMDLTDDWIWTNEPGDVFYAVCVKLKVFTGKPYHVAGLVSGTGAAPCFLMSLVFGVGPGNGGSCMDPGSLGAVNKLLGR